MPLEIQIRGLVEPKLKPTTRKSRIITDESSEESSETDISEIREPKKVISNGKLNQLYA